MSKLTGSISASDGDKSSNVFGGIGNSELDLGVVYDVPVEISVVLGRAAMTISQLLELQGGNVVELERKVGEVVDVYVNERLVAKGEIVIVEENVGITLTEIIKADQL